MSHPLSREFCDPKDGQRFMLEGQGFRLGGHLGDGAAGVVRRATSISGNLNRAIKFLAPDPKYIDVDSFDDVAQRFRREGLRGAKLHHPHLLRIYDYCENDGGAVFEAGGPRNPFLVMEYIRGRTLERYIRGLPESAQGRFSISRDRLHIAIQVATALESLRNRSLIHRDVKPANVFLTGGDRAAAPLAKLGDFGVMKWGDFQAALTTGTLTVTSQKGLGTQKYLSPEQAIEAKAVTVRSDIWSLGITLFELFSGQMLPSIFEVMEIMLARLQRGNVFSRFLYLGHHLKDEDAGIAELMLDMFLRGPTGRPAIDKVRGRLEFEYESRYNVDWRDDPAGERA